MTNLHYLIAKGESQTTEFKISFQKEVINVEDKIVAIVELKEYPMNPIAYKNRYYKRIENSNHLMSLDEIVNMHLQTINASWDYYIDERHDFSDISQENIDYFIEAIREIVINMVVHRDYRDSGNSIIKIFDDRIEFFNSGKLYDDITIEKLQSGNYSSRARNRAVARVFKEAGIIERYGSGIAKIKNECKFHGVIDPVFEEFVHGFRVTLYKEKIDIETYELLKQLLKVVKENSYITKEQLVEKVNISRATITRYIKQLKEKNLLKRVGSDKNAYWEVLDGK